MKYSPGANTDWQLDKILNGGIELGEHVRGAWVEVTLEGPSFAEESDISDEEAVQSAEEDEEFSGLALLSNYIIGLARRVGILEASNGEAPLSAEQEVFHHLGYTPVGFIVVYKDKAGDVWGTQLSNWNDQSLWLASNVQNLTVRLFVM